MLPSLRPGVRVRIERCSVDDLQRGDVAVVRRGAGLVAHRVIRRGPIGWVYRGDFLNQDDVSQGADVLLGRIVSLHLGPLCCVPPRPILRVFNFGFLGMAPATRVLAGVLQEPSRRIYQAAIRSRSLAQVRRHVQSFRVSLGDPSHWPELRRALLRRGVRPSHDVALEWERALVAFPRVPFVMLALSGRRVIGWQTVSHSTSGVGLFGLWVDHAHRGIGVATALVQAAVARLSELADSAGVTEVYADVRPGGVAERTLSRAGFGSGQHQVSSSPDHVRIVRRLGAIDRQPP